MAERSAHVTEWKNRLRRALTPTPRSTSDLVRATAIPTTMARKLLAELQSEGVAIQTILPRTKASGLPPYGWYLQPDQS